MLSASDLRLESQRSSKCKFCLMRGDKGSGKNLYWWTDAAGGKHLIHGNSFGPHRYGIVHLTVCDSTTGERYRARRQIIGGKNFDQLQEHLAEDEFGPTPAATPAPTVEDAPRSKDAEPTSFDMDSLREQLEEEIGRRVEEAMGAHHPLRVIVENRVTGEAKHVGLTHFKFPRVLAWAMRRRNIYLPGPAGTGKSYMAAQVAEALGLRFGSIALTQTKPVSDIQGYRDANGNYQDTAFYRLFKLCEECGPKCEHGFNGGVFLCDEADNGNPNTLNVFNEAIANGAFEFPHERARRHPDFVFMCAANTYGTGPDAQYVGRMQLDAAFLNRMVFVEIPIDEALEESLVMGTGVEPSDGKRILETLRRYRATAQGMRLKVAISPRNSVNMAIGIAEGDSWDVAMTECVRGGISDTDWAKVTA